MPPAKQPHKNIEDFLKDLRSRHASKLEDSFSHFEDMTNDDVQNNLYNNIFGKGHDDMYYAMDAQLQKEFKGTKKGDTAKVHGKRDELKRAAVQGLLAYFKHVDPAVIAAVEPITDLEGQYIALTREYNRHLGIEGGRGPRGRDAPISIKDILDKLMEDDQATVGHVKRAIRGVQERNNTHLVKHHVNQAATHFFHHYRDIEMGAYVQKVLADRGIEIGNHSKYLAKEKEEYIQLHRAAKKGDWKEIDFEGFGLKYAEKKSK